MYGDNLFVYVSPVTKESIDPFQFSVLSTLHLSNSYPSQEDMVNIAGILDLDLNKIKGFLHSAKSKKFGQRDTPNWMFSNLTGDYMYSLVCVCLFIIPCRVSQGVWYLDQFMFSLWFHMHLLLFSPNTCYISVSLFFPYMVVLYLYDLLESGKSPAVLFLSVSWVCWVSWVTSC